MESAPKNRCCSPSIRFYSHENWKLLSLIPLNLTSHNLTKTKQFLAKLVMELQMALLYQPW